MTDRFQPNKKNNMEITEILNGPFLLHKLIQTNARRTKDEMDWSFC